MTSKKKYFLSAVLLIRDEGEYLSEWLAWHWGQGVQHFYIYDDSRETSISDFLGEFTPCCTVRDATRYRFHLQLEAYVDALRRFGHETEWMAFIDTDEFLRSAGAVPAALVLDTMPENAAAVLCPWVVYNANGHLTKGPGPVRERFTQSVPWPFMGKMPCWKSVVRPALAVSMAAHHPTQLHPGAVLVDTNGIIRVSHFTDLPADKLVVDHYYTKSYEEWLNRLPKGSCDPFASRRLEWFETLNPGLLASAGLKLGEWPIMTP